MLGHSFGHFGGSGGPGVWCRPASSKEKLGDCFATWSTSDSLWNFRTEPKGSNNWGVRLKGLGLLYLELIRISTMWLFLSPKPLIENVVSSRQALLSGMFITGVYCFGEAITNMEVGLRNHTLSLSIYTYIYIYYICIFFQPYIHMLAF